MVSSESIWYCRNCTVAVVEMSDGPVQCEKCKAEMDKIGWFESHDSKQEGEEQED